MKGIQKLLAAWENGKAYEVAGKYALYEGKITHYGTPIVDVWGKELHCQSVTDRRAINYVKRYAAKREGEI